MECEGRTGSAPAEIYVSSFVYDEATERYRLRLDCANNHAFWAHVWLRQSDLDKAREDQSDLDKASGVKREQREEASSSEAESAPQDLPSKRPNKRSDADPFEQLYVVFEGKRDTWISEGKSDMWVGLVKGKEPVFDVSEDGVRRLLQTPAIIQKVSRDEDVMMFV